jgi:hypothetical protein
MPWKATESGILTPDLNGLWVGIRDYHDAILSGELGRYEGAHIYNRGSRLLRRPEMDRRRPRTARGAEGRSTAHRFQPPEAIPQMNRRGFLSSILALGAAPAMPNAGEERTLYARLAATDEASGCLWEESSLPEALRSQVIGFEWVNDEDFE